MITLWELCYGDCIVKIALCYANCTVVMRISLWEFCCERFALWILLGDYKVKIIQIRLYELYCGIILCGLLCEVALYRWYSVDFIVRMHPFQLFLQRTALTGDVPLAGVFVYYLQLLPWAIVFHRIVKIISEVLQDHILWTFMQTPSSKFHRAHTIVVSYCLYSIMWILSWIASWCQLHSCADYVVRIALQDFVVQIVQ